MIKIVATSDTHNGHDYVKVPECDILIHAGDFSSSGRIEETCSFLSWFERQPAKHKVFISGNHDFLGYTNSSLFKLLVKEKKDVYYLEDSGIELMGLKIWGTPWTPTFYDWAYMLDDESEEMKAKMALIPENLDILVSHGPPYKITDKTVQGEAVGSKSLLTAITDKKPKYVICGHIHEGFGEQFWQGTSVINVSFLNHRYRPTNYPVELEIE